MPDTRGNVLYVQDILDSIQNIEEYTRGYERDNFIEDRKTRDAVVRNFEIIGEAANNISSELQAACPDIPWANIVGMRNKMIHEYSGIDLEILWKTPQEDLPELKREMVQVTQKVMTP